MNALRGRVRAGHVEVEAELPEGSEVVVIVPSPDEPFELDEANLADLETRMAEAEQGDVVPARVLFDRLQSKR